MNAEHTTNVKENAATLQDFPELLEEMLTQQPKMSREIFKYVLDFVADIARRSPEELFFPSMMTNDDIREKMQLIRQDYMQKRPIKCPRCGCEKVHSKGNYRNGRKRWLCTKCKRSFNDFTGTVFGYIHKLDEMTTYLETDFFLGTAVQTAADELHVDHRTVFAWRHKFATALKNLLGKLPNEFVSVVEFFQKISLKGSHHQPGNQYKNPKVKIMKLKGERFVNGFACTDDNHRCSIQLMSFGTSIKDRIGERYLKQNVRAKKRVVVASDGKLAMISKGLKRGRGRIEREGRGKAFCDNWKNLEAPNTFFNITKCWRMKFRGVATKYQDNYFATISWIAAHFQDDNWLIKLLQELLSNCNAVREYNILKNLKLE